MGAANGLQNGIVTALHAQAHPIEALPAKTAQELGIDGVGVCFKGDLRIGSNIKGATDDTKNGCHALRAEEAGRAPKDIKEININDIKLVFNTFYHPKNMFLVVTGNFNPYEVAEIVKENQKSKNFNKYLDPMRIIPKEDKRVRVEYEELNINVTNKKIKIGIKIPKKNFKNFDDLHIRLFTGMILKANFGNTSDFKDELLQKELINSMSYMSEIFDDYLIIMITIDSEFKDEIIKLMNEKLNNLVITEETFNRIKKGNIATTILEYEDVEVVNNIIQTEILNYGKIIDNIKEIYETIEYKEIEEFIKYMDVSNKSILVLNPLEK